MRSENPRFDVAVFPMTNAVLFPGVTLPLQITDDCYWQMLEDLKSRGWPLAVSLAIPKGGTEFTLNTICGAGEVQVFRQHPDGRSDILIHGQQRVRLCAILQQEPYFVMEAEAIPTELDTGILLERTYEEFVALIKAWAFLHPSIPDQIVPIFDGFRTFGELTDFFVFHFLKKPHDQQSYLNATHPIERAEKLARFLESDLARRSSRILKQHRTSLLH